MRDDCNVTVGGVDVIDGVVGGAKMASLACTAAPAAFIAME